VALAGAEATAHEHATWWSELPLGVPCTDAVEQLRKAILDPDLHRAKSDDRVSTWHSGAKRLERTASLHGTLEIWASETLAEGNRPQVLLELAHEAPSRTSEENGLSRLTSRTSSKMRSLSAW
jgi:hypothetical protein